MPYARVYLSENTKIMLTDLRIEAIEKYAKTYGVPIALVKAVCKKESENKTFAIRIEYHLKKAKWYTNTLAWMKKEEVEDYHFCSFGLMQVMYGVARHMGYMGSPFAMCNPKVGVKYGTKYLAKQIKRYKGKMWDAVAAYNQGNNRYYDINKNGIKDENEKYRNQDYVTKVKLYFDMYTLDPKAVV